MLQLQPAAVARFGHLDIEEVLYGTGVLATHWPYWTFPFLYHPVIGWGSALLSYVAPHLVIIVLMWGLIVAIAAGAVAALLLPVVGRRRTLVFWSLSPQLLLFGGANFDALAVLSLVAAGALLARSRATASGIMVGVGTATKLFPIVGLPPFALSLFVHGAKRRAVALTIAAIAVLAVLDGPAIVAPFSLLGSGITPFHEASWGLDSIWTPFALMLGTTLDPVTIDRAVIAVSIAGLVASYGLLVIAPVLRGRDPNQHAWIGVCLVLLWTRLYSPQYAIWLLPVFALYVPRPGLLAFMALADALTFFTIFGLGETAPSFDDPVKLLMIAGLLIGVIARHAALVLLTLRTLRAHAVPLRAALPPGR